MKRLRLTVLALVTAIAVVIPSVPAAAYYPKVENFRMLHRTISGTQLLLISALLSFRSTPPRAGASGETPMEDCATGAPVKFQRLKNGSWVTIAKGKTNDNGKIKRKVPDKKGKYRIYVKAYTTPGGNNCFEGYSAVKRHSH